jgi:hypothetical protein
MARSAGIDRPPCFLTPVADFGRQTAGEIIKLLLDHRWYWFREGTKGRTRIEPGSPICFYQSRVGLVAEAVVSSPPELGRLDFAPNPERFPWIFGLRDVRYFFDQPVIIDAALRARMDAFRNRDPEGHWTWFISATRIVTPHDFDLLTGRA